LKPAIEKKEVIQNLLQNPEQIAQLNEGFLPPYMHNLLRTLLGLVFGSFMIRLLWKVGREGKPSLVQSATYTWLKWFTTLFSLAIISILLILILPPTATLNRTLGIHLSVIICFVVLNFYLFFRPQILYGLPRLRMENIKVSQQLNGEIKEPDLHAKAYGLVEENNEVEHAGNGTSLEYLTAYKPILELHLEKNRPYLQQGYNVAKLSAETGIPQHHLSALLNKVYGVRFNDFINQYRIKHITSHFDKDGWNKMTLEGMASEAGFNSRTTFFNAIKKSTGLSPSEYINKIKTEKEETGN
jgi:AraC-like DNA-binding protein